MTETDLPEKCLCRLCGKYELCTNIFSATGKRQLLALKIGTCLPIQVHIGDNVTKGVCPTCIIKLNSAYELLTTCVLVQSKLEDATKNHYQNGEEVTSSVTKPLPPSVDKSLPDSALDLYPFTVDNVAQFNRLSNGSIRVNDKEASPPIPVISSVLTLASGPTKPTKPEHCNNTNMITNSQQCALNNTCDDQERPKKERKTVCRYCKQWYPRSKINDHESSHCNNNENNELYSVK